MPTEPADLQFDKIELANTSATAGVTCANCQKPIEGRYYQIAQHPLCENCRSIIASELAARQARANSPLALSRSALYGLGAAVAGGALYFAVMLLTRLEIGLIAIASGYLIGKAVRMGAGGGGGVRHQVLAGGLTYLSVVFAYAPAKLAELRESASAAQGASSTAFELLAAPLQSVFTQLPSSLIGGLIIGFGVYQAWRMTGDLAAPITGPFQVGDRTTPNAS